MTITHETSVTKDASGKKLIVTRGFNAPLDKVWKAWTESSLLDKWWAPKPFVTQTKSMNFTPGGRWLYAMTGPEGEKHWCKVDFQDIDNQKSFSAIDAFCDEDGNTSDTVAPPMQWLVTFTQDGGATIVTVDITFNSEEDLEKIVQMGFKEGFTMAHSNLDELLATA